MVAIQHEFHSEIMRISDGKSDFEIRFLPL